MPSLLDSSGRRPMQSAANSTSSLTTGRNSSPDDGWVDVDLSSTEYTHKRRELMQLIGDLLSLGARAVIDVPSIVVIGGQSAGKSSLVEAICGISVPRDSGTCTRCPMECSMSTSATTWSCKIKLRFDYGALGQPAVPSRQIDFGPTITNPNEVEIWLRRAQTAILNEDCSPDSFYSMTKQDLRIFSSPGSRKFSKNVVSIFIEDPDATDLLFVDLPGLIQNEDQGMIQLVQDLTEAYIRRENSIILVTIPMSDDIQNQLAVRLAKGADPEGERTIGVLTKPDTLGPGAVNSKRAWANIIEGHQHILRHGYYCVRLPDDAQRAQGLSRPELQRMAADYFDNNSPWRDVANRRRFGIPGFLSDISVLFVQLIYRVLPQLKEEVERLLAACLQEMDTLPKPVGADPQHEVLARVGAFCVAFEDMVSGTGPDKTLAQRNRALYTLFAQEVRKTSPDFRPFEQPEEYDQITALDSEEEEVDLNPLVETMGVLEVRKTILESFGWELPGNIPYEAKVRLINQFTNLWLASAEACLWSINGVLDDVVQQLIETHFGRFSVLQELILGLILPDVEEYKGFTLTAVKETLALETSPLYTQNQSDYLTLRDEWLEKYRHTRRYPERDGIHDPETAPGYYAGRMSPVDEALCSLARAGYTGLTVDDLTRLSPPDDQFDDELKVMAEVRAYFTIAYKRIIDHVPLKIEHCLHHALVKRLSSGLVQRLIADAASSGNFAERMKELVSEDPVIERRRTQLEGKHSRLLEIKRKLSGVAM